MENETIKLHGFKNDSISYCEAIGLSKVFEEYAKHHAGSEILDEGLGFNPNSGYIYLTLEDGFYIASCMGQDIEYIHTDFETGEETFFESFQDYTEFLQNNEN